MTEKKKRKKPNRLAKGMAKKTKVTKETEEVSGEMLVKSLSEEERNALHVLDKDDEGYAFSELEKRFITQWIDFKNLVVVSATLGISQKDSSTILTNSHVRKEIDRLSLARMKFRFARRILTLDECESYLTTAITDEGVALSDQLNSKDKLNAMRLLLDIKQMKADSLSNPTIIDNTPIEQQLEELSIETIKQLLDTKLEKKEDIATNIAVRQQIMQKIPQASESEKKDINSMSPNELLKIIDNIEKK